MLVNIPDIRTGIGFDSHALGPDRRLVLGGVVVPHDLGLVGHSDMLGHAKTVACWPSPR